MGSMTQGVTFKQVEGNDSKNKPQQSRAFAKEKTEILWHLCGHSHTKLHLGKMAKVDGKEKVWLVVLYKLMKT